MAGARRFVGKGGHTGRPCGLRVVRKPYEEPVTTTRKENNGTLQGPNSNEGYQLDPVVQYAISYAVAAAEKEFRSGKTVERHARTTEKAGKDGKKGDDDKGEAKGTKRSADVVEYVGKKIPKVAGKKTCKVCGKMHLGECKAGSNQCYRCGEKGHITRDCIEDRKCYRCGKSGHLARDCGRATTVEETRRDEFPICGKCGKKHLRECRMGLGVCFRCGIAGHLSWECKDHNRCHNCGGRGHLARDCKKPKEGREAEKNA